MRSALTALLAAGAVGWAVIAYSAASANGNGSDVVRQWVVCQYVYAGTNPYDLAKDVLIAKYGATNPERAKIYAIPKEVPAERAGDVIAGIGPPEAVYPPPAVGLLSFSVGLLPDGHTVWLAWFVFNLIAAMGVAVGLARLWSVPPGGATPSDNIRFTAAALLLFPATYCTMEAGQFSLVVLGLLLAANAPSLGWLTRGAALGVALFKPSIALPFFFLPLVRRQWRVLFTAMAVQAAAGLYVAWQIGGLIGPFKEWLWIAGFVLQAGMFTLPEWLGAVNMPGVVTAASLGVLALCAATLAAARNLPPARLFAIAAATSAFWTLHGPYDFVVLLPVLLPLAGWSAERPGKRWSAVGLALFSILALALTPAVYGGDEPATRIIRWAARFVVLGLVVREYLAVYLCFVRFRTKQTPAADHVPVSNLYAETTR